MFAEMWDASKNEGRIQDDLNIDRLFGNCFESSQRIKTY